LVANADLVVQAPNIHLGIRHVDGEWHEARFVVGSHEIRELSCEDVKGRLRNASEIDIGRMDRSKWQLHYRDSEDNSRNMWTGEMFEDDSEDGGSPNVE